jgi:hypothetical protein
MFRSAHEPGARFVRDARLGPFLERNNKCVLSQFLGQTNIPHDACQTRNELGRLHPPNSVNGSMDFGAHNTD